MAQLTEEQKGQALRLLQTPNGNTEVFDYLLDIVGYEEDCSKEEDIAFANGFIRGFWVSAEIAQYMLKNIKEDKDNE